MPYFPAIVICTQSSDGEKPGVLKVWLESDYSSQESEKLKTLQSRRVQFSTYLNKEYWIEKKLRQTEMMILLHWLRNEAEEYTAEWHCLQELPTLSPSVRNQREILISSVMCLKKPDVSFISHWNFRKSLVLLVGCIFPYVFVRK